MWNLFKANNKDTRKKSFLYPFLLVQKWRVTLVSLLLTLNIFPIILLFLLLHWTSKCCVGVSYITSSKLGNKEILCSKMNWIFFLWKYYLETEQQVTGYSWCCQGMLKWLFYNAKKKKLSMANEGTINNEMEMTKVNKHILFCG